MELFVCRSRLIHLGSSRCDQAPPPICCDSNPTSAVPRVRSPVLRDHPSAEGFTILLSKDAILTNISNIHHRLWFKICKSDLWRGLTRFTLIWPVVVSKQISASARKLLNLAKETTSRPSPFKSGYIECLIFPNVWSKHAWSRNTSFIYVAVNLSGCTNY